MFTYVNAIDRNPATLIAIRNARRALRIAINPLRYAIQPAVTAIPALHKMHYQ